MTRILDWDIGRSEFIGIRFRESNGACGENMVEH